tara:strand:- start:846 stop:1493 length:648 start_codon:yes stop_codon:yes gene_type:complete
MDLSAGTKVDPNGLLDSGNSTLGTTSTIAVNTGAQGLWDSGLDGLGFFFDLGALPALAQNNSGIVLRLKFDTTSYTSGSWRIALGMSANAGAAAWTSGGFMGGMLLGNSNARRDPIGGSGSTGTNLSGNTGRLIDTYLQFNPAGTGQTGPEIRGILTTVTDAAKANSAQVGAATNPSASLAGNGYAVFGIGNTSSSAVCNFTGIEASYQLIPRQP